MDLNEENTDCAAEDARNEKDETCTNGLIYLLLDVGERQKPSPKVSQLVAVLVKEVDNQSNDSQLAKTLSQTNKHIVYQLGLAVLKL